MSKDNASVNWSVTAVLGLSFLVAITIVPWYGIVHGFNGWTWLFFGIFVILNGIGIGSGYHRLWSHRTYDAHPILKWFFAVLGGMSLQNSIIVWSARHRVHHRDVDDNDRDPYSIGRGFWFAHIGWMLRDYDSGKIDYSVVRDLEKDPVAAWARTKLASAAEICGCPYSGSSSVTTRPLSGAPKNRYAWPCCP